MAVTFPTQERVIPWVDSQAKVRIRGWQSKLGWVLVLVDLLACAAGVLAPLILVPDNTDSGILGFDYLTVALVLSGLWTIALGLSDSRDYRLVGFGMREYGRVIGTSFAVLGAAAIIAFAFKAEPSRTAFVIAMALGLSMLLVGRWLVRRVLVRMRADGRALTPTLVVGTGRSVGMLVEDLRSRPEAGYVPSAVCVLDHLSEDVLFAVRGCRSLAYDDLAEVSGSGHFGAVILADGLSREQTRRIAWDLEDSSVELMLQPRLIDASGPRLVVREVEGLSLTHVDLPAFSGSKLVIKRTFDVFASVFALVVLSPLLLLVAVAIKLDDGGPVMFRQQRIGLRGRPFTIHKFRSMCLDAEERIDELIAANGGRALLFKMEDDPRITRLGRFLRKYSLDELPQFWSVLRGDMSLVGPRPQVAREVAEYSDVHLRRLLIKPGITGLWQVNGRSELSPEDSVRFDLRYVENWSLPMDLAIMLKTVGVVIRASGAR